MTFVWTIRDVLLLSVCASMPLAVIGIYAYAFVPLLLRKLFRRWR